MSQAATIKCNHCGGPMPKDESNNYRCIAPECGRGKMTGTHGVSIIIGDDGSVTITGGPGPADGKADQS